MKLFVMRLIGFLTVLCVAASVVGQEANSVIEQSRLFQSSRQTPGTAVDANGMRVALPENAQPEDVSFGKQQILKNEERIPEFSVGGDASVFYTSNVALTRRDEVGDVFFCRGCGFELDAAD